MVVAQLAKAGFITEVATTRAGQRPERTVYAITDAGRDELRDWLRGLLAEPVHEYPGFVSALSLIGAPHPDDVVGLLRSRLDRLSEQRAENQKLVDDALAGGLPELFLIEEEYRIAQAETEETFVRRLIECIRDPRTGWAPAWAQVHDALAAGTPPPSPASAGIPPGTGSRSSIRVGRVCQ
jgi:DNA-binding PadR family transcriptional regulator